VRPRFVVLSLATLVWLVDVVSKQWALTNLADGHVIHLVGPSFLRLTANPGAAFSMGTDHTWVFTLLAIVVLIGILMASARVTSAAWILGLGGLAGGAAGNLTDRLVQPPSLGFGHVVDFIMVGSFPVFNLADTAIVCSVALMFIASAINIPMSTPSAAYRADARS
jgi:signal peptidase II